MSADNYNYIRRNVNGGWDVWLNLCASSDHHKQVNSREPDRTFQRAELAHIQKWIELQGYTEYGTHIEENPHADEPAMIALGRVESVLESLPLNVQREVIDRLIRKRA